MEHGKRRIYGVDFSGAEDAGTKIWIARSSVENNGLVIEDCCPASDLPYGGRDRVSALAALHRLVETAGDAALGFDFPFSLPSQFFAAFNLDEWESLIRSFPELFPNPAAFRAGCLDIADGRELRRPTDRRARTPFSPYNLRLYLQTYHGITSLLAPLVLDGLASVIPMQSAEPGKPWLMEICPASTLRRIEIYYAPYKGDTSAHSSVRRVMLTSLEKKGPLSFAEDAVRARVVANAPGDALDSVVAAFAVFKNLRDPSMNIHAPTTGEAWRLEGHVYT